MTKIKKTVMGLAVAAFTGVLKSIYFFMKFFPGKEKKILFCSRQSDDIPLDFRLLEEEIKEKESGIECVFICKKIHSGLKDYMIFLWALLKSMYHLATSRVCIVDSYWPTVSLLHHKKEIKIIQIWHSLGKTKKSGYQTLDKKSGRDSSTSKMLKMHENYDYLVGGAKIWNPYYCEAFNISEDKIINCGLPRIDYLIKTEETNRERFFNEFPELQEKKIVLYAPTFRRHMKSHWGEIFKFEVLEDVVVILKNHPGQQKFQFNNKPNIIAINDWKTMDLISVCDYLITDYSSIALEAAVLNKKTYYWVYDYDEYMLNNGMNIDLKIELFDNMFKDIEDIIDCIEHNKFNDKQYNAYREKYLPDIFNSPTKYLVEFIFKLIYERREYYANSNNGRWESNAMEELSRNA